MSQSSQQLIQVLLNQDALGQIPPSQLVDQPLIAWLQAGISPVRLYQAMAELPMLASLELDRARPADDDPRTADAAALCRMARSRGFRLEVAQVIGWDDQRKKTPQNAPPDESFARTRVAQTQLPRVGPSGAPRGLRSGDSLGDRYQLGPLLGTGGMGLVFRSWDAKLQREVALKTLRPDSVAFEDDSARRAVKRFLLEGQVAAKLRHPNLVQVHEVGELDGVLYLTMELVEGVGLDEIVRSERWPDRRVAAFMLKIASAVDVAHQVGIVHRDIKPSNILIDQAGEPHVADFGLARDLATNLTRITRPGSVLGTPTHLSPEQCLGQCDLLGPHTDVWSIGVTMFELLSGELPFSGPSLPELLRSIVDEPTPELACSPQMRLICDRCLKKQTGQRYATAGALARDLQRYLDGTPVQARAPARAGLAALLRRHARLALALGLLLLALLLWFIVRST